MSSPQAESAQQDELSRLKVELGRSEAKVPFSRRNSARTEWYGRPTHWIWRTASSLGAFLTLNERWCMMRFDANSRGGMSHSVQVQRLDSIDSVGSDKQKDERAAKPSNTAAAAAEESVAVSREVRELRWQLEQSRARAEEMHEQMQVPGRGSCSH